MVEAPDNRDEISMRGLKAILLACVAGTSLSTPRARLDRAVGHLQRRCAGTAIFAAHADQHEERLEAEARVAVRRRGHERGCDGGRAGRSQAVPILVRGVLYTSTARRTIVALDPATGKEIWKHELEKGGAPNRGVSDWPGDRRLAPRILAGTTDGRLIALDAATGKLVPDVR